MAYQGPVAVIPSSTISTIPGWRRLVSVPISRRMLANLSGVSAPTVLSATCRRLSLCSAMYTTPMPPRPRTPWIR